MTRRRRLRRDYGSILLGSRSDNRILVRVRVQTLLTLSIVLSNLIGAVLAASLALVGIPSPSLLQRDMWWINAIALPVYVLCAFVVGIVGGTVSLVRSLSWAIAEREPTKADARRTRRAPWTLVRLQGSLWLGAVILLTTCYGIVDPEVIPKVVFTSSMSGIVVVAVSYLFVEFALRPINATLIDAGFRRKRRGGVGPRAILFWMLGSGIPLTGIILVLLFGITSEDTSKLDLFISIIVLACIALATGLLLTILSSRSIVDPLRSVRQGMRRVADGDTDVDLVVYDGTELGDLQGGFNAMVDGLRERDRMRDLFGRHVGRDVASAALDSDPELGGSEKTVAIVFVDVIGSTTLATQRAPGEVVEALNAFFGVVVRAVDERRGLVNKFEGDAVLAIFGAPVPLDDAAGAALAAAREIAAGLAADVPDLDAGIGVGFGPVVAGNVGAIERFEYTVIGDPVNESARLSELAKRDPSRPLASGRAIAAAGAGESGEWERQEAIRLRGRADETEVYAARPRGAGASST